MHRRLALRRTLEVRAVERALPQVDVAVSKLERPADGKPGQDLPAQREGGVEDDLGLVDDVVELRRDAFGGKPLCSAVLLLGYGSGKVYWPVAGGA